MCLVARDFPVQQRGWLRWYLVCLRRGPKPPRLLRRFSDRFQTIPHCSINSFSRRRSDLRQHPDLRRGAFFAEGSAFGSNSKRTTRGNIETQPLIPTSKHTVKNRWE